MSSKSDCLYHFTSPEVALQILHPVTGGFLPSYSLEDGSLFIDDELWSPLLVPMVCFCDIPSDLCIEHSKKYGKIGIGISKQWALANGISPILYVVRDSSQHGELKSLFQKGAQNGVTQLDGFKSILSHTKPFKGFLWNKQITNYTAETINVEFYSECEWRYVPQGMPHHMHQPFSSAECQEINQQSLDLRLNALLKFGAADIVRIVVSPSVFDSFSASLGSLPTNAVALVKGAE